MRPGDGYPHGVSPRSSGSVPGGAYRLHHVVRTRLWLVPLLCMLAGATLAAVTIAIDRSSDYGLVSQDWTGTPTDVQTILSTAVSSLVSLITVVLGLTLVAIQLAMGQFSPRIVRTLLGDRRSQLTVGVFLATLIVSLAALREVDDAAAGGGTIPGLTVLVAYALLVASIVALVLYIHHAGQSLRVSSLIDLVGDSTREQLQRMYPDPLEAPAGDADGELHEADERCVTAAAPGVVIHVDHDGLVAAAKEAGQVFELVPAMGDFVCGGAPLLRLHGPAMRPATDLRSHVVLADERTHEADPAYGIRKLVDIAERSIASGPFDDPTTTVQALDRLHDCLRQLVTRRFPDGRHLDDEGDLRLTTHEIDWAGYVRLAFDEIRLAGSASPQVARRLRAALEDLTTVAPPDRQAPLERQLALLKSAVSRQYDDEDDVRAILVADAQGVGSGRDVTTYV
ncbi:MAG: conserved rane protein of unknown function [Solirubrobacterales bacterium]|nr:conserved rane protein of unknown function [Solirubrobacterales bacterium]